MSNRNGRTASLIAANRFGYGPRLGELEAIGTDPRGWLKAQLRGATPEPMPVPSTRAMFEQEAAWRLERGSIEDRQARREARQAQGRTRNRQRLDQMAARMRLAIETQRPFRERLVRFWSNHFTIAISTLNGRKGVLRTIAVPYEHEAIRRNLSADFTTLLLAVEQHPAMLVYLDNERSIGPNSVASKRRNKLGLNENLAREVLELHTLSAGTGYTEADVRSLARMITGWTVARRNPRPDANVQWQAGDFRFVQNRHEPGSHALLGKHYEAKALAQGENALKDLARHPATARHIATKLVAHLVADTPPPTAVARIERVFLDSDGSLPAIHEALVDLEEAWQPQHRKLKTPEELVVSTARALGVDAFKPGKQALFKQLSRQLRAFNHFPFTAGSPEGWPDGAEHWGSPNALMKRINWANRVAARSPATLDPLLLYAGIMPENNELEQAIAGAESRRQGLALLLASPDFQWR